MIYDIRHVTRVRYGAAARLAQFNLRLAPMPWPGQTVLDHRFRIEPAPARQHTRPGAYWVNETHVAIEQPLSDLVIESRARMRVETVAPVPALSDPTVAAVAQAARDVRSLDALAPALYLYPSPLAPLVPVIADWALSDLAPDRGVIDAALALARRVHAGLRYDPAATSADTPTEQAFAQRAGVCQDFTHIMIVALRAAGLPAAYASGYLRTQPPPGQPRLIGADAMHAWVLLWCGPDHGWIGFDPTNAIQAGTDHITLAIGRDFSDVSPVYGVFVGSGEHELKVEVDVVPA